MVLSGPGAHLKGGLRERHWQHQEPTTMCSAASQTTNLPLICFACMNLSGLSERAVCVSANEDTRATGLSRPPCQSDDLVKRLSAGTVRGIVIERRSPRACPITCHVRRLSPGVARFSEGASSRNSLLERWLSRPDEKRCGDGQTTACVLA
jgi:hypothetical protein